MSNKVYSIDNEMFYPDFDTIISDLEDQDEPVLGATYFEGDSVKQLPSRYFNFEHILDQMECAAYDDAPEEMDEDEFFNWKRDPSFLRELINSWLDENVECKFYSVKNVVEKVITEDDL